MKFHARRAAFTLLEMLVVIAVISILAALLFPVFARARDNGRRASCQSNLKQLGLAIAQYNSDYDEKYPMGLGADWNDGWPTAIEPYVKSVAVFRCPSDNPDIYIPADWDLPSWAGSTISYAANGLVQCQGACNDSIPGDRLLGVMQMAQPWLGDNPRQMSQIHRPAQTILLSEKHNRDTTSVVPDGFSVMSSFGPAQLFSGTTEWDSYGAGAIPDGTRGPATFPAGPNGSVSANHFGTANFLFCDGHVKPLRPETTNPDPIGRPDDNLWNSMRP